MSFVRQGFYRLLACWQKMYCIASECSIYGSTPKKDRKKEKNTTLEGFRQTLTPKCSGPLQSSLYFAGDRLVEDTERHWEVH